ncbi:hypothetical protein CEXT_312691 [Caerostris extrusa]|uniref:Uncharacterized protein n=1 Tax=Caerostris extrusa TaxID=172846 RepID=A0AAV4UIL1_CAEEX|nr:hypothetical protein CEXT_312691 [Caerostris extrusa]
MVNIKSSSFYLKFLQPEQKKKWAACVSIMCKMMMKREFWEPSFCEQKDTDPACTVGKLVGILGSCYGFSLYFAPSVSASFTRMISISQICRLIAADWLRNMDCYLLPPISRVFDGYLFLRTRVQSDFHSTEMNL